MFCGALFCIMVFKINNKAYNVKYFLQIFTIVVFTNTLSHEGKFVHPSLYLEISVHIYPLFCITGNQIIFSHSHNKLLSWLYSFRSGAHLWGEGGYISCIQKEKCLWRCLFPRKLFLASTLKYSPLPNSGWDLIFRG